MMYPLVSELKADGFCVSMVCRVLGFSKQGYYKWVKRPFPDRDWNEAHIVNKIIDIHVEDREFGYRLITDELIEQGVKISEWRVQRLCCEYQII